MKTVTKVGFIDTNSKLKKSYIIKNPNLSKEQIAEVLNIESPDIIEAKVSHTYDAYNILEDGLKYEYSTYEIITKQ